MAHTCPPLVNYVDEKYLINFVYEWNNTFPIDRWWREKYNIPFNSQKHREVSVFDMRFEYEEDVIYNKIRKEQDYVIGSGEIFNKKQEREDIIDEKAALDEFLKEEDGFDYTKYND